MGIIVEEDQRSDAERQLDSSESKILTWIMPRIQSARDYRDMNYREKWIEYYNLWRGNWTSKSKNHNSERSRLISPALQQAIEVAVAEQEEAIFGKGKWFSLQDDVIDLAIQDLPQDPNQPPESLVNLYLTESLLQEDLDRDGIREAVNESLMYGALYGTGVIKLVVDVVRDISVNSGQVEEVERVRVKPVAVDIRSFFIDPSAKDIESSLFCGEDMYVPKHTVLSKMDKGIYRKVSLGAGLDDDNSYVEMGEAKSPVTRDQTKITEYHGLIPRKYLENFNTDITLSDDEEIVDLGIEDEDDLEAFELVEAIVTIANDGIVLRAKENPTWFKDRAYVAYQFEKVPNKFYGRGVAEKGYNAQKALDAELRARIDAMALTIHPMMAADVTRLSSKVSQLTVSPGKTVFTNGNPREILEPLNFGNVNPVTFTQSGEFERMIQMATGSMDSATPVGISPRNSTASGMSMILSGMIKRSKRTLRNIEQGILKPLVHKVANRYMQFDPDRYKAIDVKFRVFGSLGIMARELETQQNTQLLNTVPPDSPAYWMLIKNIFNNSTIENKDKMLELVDMMLERTMNPQPDPVAEKAKELELAKMEAEIQNVLAQAEQYKAVAQSQLDKSGDTLTEKDVLDLKLKEEEIRTNAEVKMKEVILNNQTKIEVEKIKSQADIIKESAKKEAEDNKKQVKSEKKSVRIIRDSEGKIQGAEVVENNSEE